MKVTVAICTWNRASLLDQTLAEMRRLQIPDGLNWELLIVNNNCSDHTDEVIERYASQLPIQRLFEPRQGIARARNRAAASAKGDVLVWTDDDVLVDPGWLAAYCTAFEQHPAVGFYGGAVEPWFAAEPPAWLRRNLDRVEGAYAVRRIGGDDRPMASNESPVNANMAVRLSVMKEFQYDNTLGAAGAELMRGEETALIERFRAAGYQGMWVGGAKVRHYIPEERLSTDFLWRLAYGGGRTHVRMNGIPQCPYAWGAPRWAVRRYWQRRLESWLFAPFKSRRWLDAYLHTAQLRGLIDECRATARIASAASCPHTPPRAPIKSNLSP